MTPLYRFTDENGNSAYLEQRPAARGEDRCHRGWKGRRTLLAPHYLKGLTKNP